MSDNVNHPSHYADGWSNGAEVIDITEHLNFCKGNAIKYLARAGRKDPDKELEDLRKAAWYVQREIERVEGSRVVDPRDLQGNISAFGKYLNGYLTLTHGGGGK